MPLNTCVHVVVLRLYQHSCRKGPTPRDANGKNEWHPGSLTVRWRSVFLMSKGENDQLFVYFKFLRIAILIVRLRITHLSIVWSNTLTLIGINNPGDSSGVQSCPGRHPNHSAGSCFFLYSFFSPLPNGIHTGAVEALRLGTTVFVKRPEASLHITSFGRVQGRITHGCRSAVPGPDPRLPGSTAAGTRDVRWWGGAVRSG